jgi:cobaltochelatase CobN
LPRLDTYLCDLKESQIRDGLHVFGESPQGRLRIDTLLALLRIPRGDGRGRNRACCARWPRPSSWASTRSIAPWPSPGPGASHGVAEDR